MDNSAVIYRLVLGLSSLIALPQVALAESMRSAQLKETDPSGLILTFTAVSVVFLALILLVVVFKSIGKLLIYLAKRSETQAGVSSSVSATPHPSAKESRCGDAVAIAIALSLAQERVSLSNEAMAALGFALHQYGVDCHDHESYRLTIRHRPTQWNDKSLCIRQYPS